MSERVVIVTPPPDCDFGGVWEVVDEHPCNDGDNHLRLRQGNSYIGAFRSHVRAALTDFAAETAEKMRCLEIAGREYGKHSGPGSTPLERGAFSRDLRTAALRFARAYYAEARELGLIPEYERRPAPVAGAALDGAARNTAGDTD
jgi:hypothetical protein